VKTSDSEYKKWVKIGTENSIDLTEWDSEPTATINIRCTSIFRRRQSY